MEDLDLDGMADVYGDLSHFDKRMKHGKVYKDEDSSEEDDQPPVDRTDPVQVLEEKNRMLLDRLYKSEK